VTFRVLFTITWLDEESEYLSFNQESRVAAKWLAPTPHEHQARDMLVTIITDIIRTEFRREAPFMEVEAFGSHVNQLYLPGG
jgi:DNA polymerase sigma